MKEILKMIWEERVTILISVVTATAANVLLLWLGGSL